MSERHDSNIKNLKKFKEQFIQECCDAALDKVENYINDVYQTNKTEIEKVTVLSEDKNEAPVVSSVSTQITFKRSKAQNKNILHVEMGGVNRMDKDALTASWHGTGLHIRSDILEYIFGKAQKQSTPTTEEGQTQQEMGKYYIDPSNADTRFVLSIKGAKIK